MTSPFVRTGWNKYEVALLLESYKSVAAGETPRKVAVSALSKRLRNRMLLHGVEINDKYRNENGIDLQMSAVEYVLSDGEKGLDRPSKLFYEIAELSVNNTEVYYSILKEALTLYPEPVTNLYKAPEEENLFSTVCESEPLDERLATLLRNILSTRFAKGFRKNSSIDKKKLNAYYRDAVGKDLEASEDELYRYLDSFGVEIDQKIFVPEVMLPNDVREAIHKQIASTFASGRNVVYYDQLFKIFKDSFLSSPIATEAMLEAYLKFYYRNKWHFTSRYVSTNENVEVSVDDEVIAFVREQCRLITEDEVVSALSWLPEKNVRQAFNRNASVLIAAGRNIKFHIELFVITPTQIDAVCNIINSAIDKYQFIGADELLSDIQNTIPELLSNNNSITDLGIRKALAVHLNDEFSFNNSIISKKGHDLTAKGALLSFVQSHDEFVLSEIDALADALGTVLNYHLAALMPFVVRIDDENFVAHKLIHFDVEGVDQALDALFVGGNLTYLPLRSIKNFTPFPSMSVSWNQRLLESYLLTQSSRYGLVYAEYLNKNAVCGAVILKSSHNDTSFEGIIAKALIDNKIALNKTDALNFLAEEGYIYQRRYNGIETVIGKAKAIKKGLTV